MDRLVRGNRAAALGPRRLSARARLRLGGATLFMPVKAFGFVGDILLVCLHGVPSHTWRLSICGYHIG